MYFLVLFMFAQAYTKANSLNVLTYLAKTLILILI